MARPSILVVVACLVFAIGSVSAALTAPEIVANINTLTIRSQVLQYRANEINTINGPLLAINLGPFPQIIAGFDEIYRLGTNALDEMEGTPTLSSDDCQLVADAYSEFVRVHQQLLNILSEKAGLFKTAPLIGNSVASALRGVQSFVNSFANSLIDIAEGVCKTDIDQQRQALDSSFPVAITSYDGLVAVNLP